MDLRLLEPLPGEDPDQVDRKVADAELAQFRTVQAML